MNDETRQELINDEAWWRDREWFDQTHLDEEPELPLLPRVWVWIAERVARIWGGAK